MTPTAIETTTLRKPALEGTIRWNQVRILPRASENYPVESGSNHYYAARKTDASPIEVRTGVADAGAATSQREKFLFYRGIGNFALPLAAMVGPDGRVVVKSATAQPLGDVMLFENAGGAPGYRVLGGTGQEVTLDRPAAAGRDKAVRVALERMLVANGLYAKEAAAMVETWRDSWFEEGLRLFYIVPRAAIDDVLPLEVTPAPASTARVFVGRIELITPAIVAEVKKAVLAKERAPIVKVRPVPETHPRADHFVRYGHRGRHHQSQYLVRVYGGLAAARRVPPLAGLLRCQASLLSGGDISRVLRPASRSGKRHRG